MASIIVFSEGTKIKYTDRKAVHTPEEIAQLESVSSTVYVGKLANRESNFVSEAQIYTIFSQCGPIKKIIMGIFKEDNSPAGFCFVEYYFHEDALAAIKWLNGTYVLGRKIDVDIDYGFEEGRQYRRYPKNQPRRRDGHQRRQPRDSY
ncbi:hypothetical protein M9Y10_004957 [Tritrichomonas musculus]|uniref:Nuclear cap-binding protein subunit 2 n=1 Tax=Tritrichomonas musculus TaxID=1915356 RepID=A0ABR2JKJ9_9EUKA